jgi:hypothetical protein
MALRPTQPPIQWVPGFFSWGWSGWGVKLTTHLHLVPRSRMRGFIPLLPQYVFMAWSLVKHRDNFTFTFCHKVEYPNCILRWATGWTIGVVGSIPGGGWEFFSSPPCPKRLWGLPSHLSDGFRGDLSLGVKRPGREADHSPSSSAEVKEWVELCIHSPICLHGVVPG